MSTVALLKKFIHSLDPQKNVHRFTFYNFLCHYCSDKEKFNDDILFKFFNHVYQIEHWQKNKHELLTQVHDLVERFQRHVHNFSTPTNIKTQFDWQLIDLKRDDDFINCVTEHLSRQLTDKDNVKVRLMDKDKCLCLVLGHDGIVQIRVYSKSFKIFKGELCPTAPITHLFYNKRLEFLPNTLQVLAIDKHTQAHIYPTTNGGGMGHLMRGYSLHKHSRFEFESFEEHPDLYQKLKHLEHHFIQPKSDPDYINLTLLVEKSTQILLTGEPGSEKLARTTYQKAQYASENLFPNDKYLKLLLSQLELAIVKSARRTTEPKLEL